MRTALAPLAAGAVLSVVATASAAGIERRDFRYERVLPMRVASGRVAFEPDGSMLAHAKAGLADMRIVDARGRQVPWRRVAEEQLSARPGRLLNTGKQGPAAVALVDLGSRPRFYDRIELDVRGNEFVGRVTVSGSDRRAGPWTRLSTTRIYDVTGATSARSTTALVPPSDFRYLRLRAAGVEAIEGASVYGPFERPRLVRRRHTLLAGPRQQGRETVLTLDFGVSGVPVTRLELRAATRRYDRRVRLEASGERSAFLALAAGRIRRAPGELSPPLVLSSRSRYVRVIVENGDDPPLRGVRAETFGPSFAVVVEPGHATPLRVFYGAPTVGAPSYEFARLSAGRPFAVLDPSQLGPERLNPMFEPPEDTRSFLERHDWLVQLAVALAALAVGAAGLLALRRRA